MKMEEPPVNPDLVPVKSFPYRVEAERAQQVLQAAGIASLVRGDDAGGWAPHLSFAGGGVTLFVDRQDYDRATEVLEQIQDVQGEG